MYKEEFDAVRKTLKVKDEKIRRLELSEADHLACLARLEAQVALCACQSNSISDISGGRVGSVKGGRDVYTQMRETVFQNKLQRSEPSSFEFQDPTCSMLL